MQRTNLLLNDMMALNNKLKKKKQEKKECPRDSKINLES